MNENELHERYIRLAFQYESAIDALLTKGSVSYTHLLRFINIDAHKFSFWRTLREFHRLIYKAVSYTHLDVYKRQPLTWPIR